MVIEVAWVVQDKATPFREIAHLPKRPIETRPTAYAGQALDGDVRGCRT